jgi:hypothetical protein
MDELVPTHVAWIGSGELIRTEAIPGSALQRLRNVSGRWQ